MPVPSRSTTDAEVSDVPDLLVAWFQGNGGSISNLSVADDEEMGLCLMTTESVQKGDVVMSIPTSLCMTMETAEASDLKPVLQAYPELLDSPDEVLALHLMREKLRGTDSFWYSYLRTLPKEVDTPLGWILHDDEEFTLLEGTMVGLLARMMNAQVMKDWEQVHLPLVEAFPALLGGLTFEDYYWAFSSIWSRAFDYVEQRPDGQALSRRAMVPVINAANHHPSAGGSLADMVELEAVAATFSEAGGTGSGIVVDGDSTDKTKGFLRVRAGRSYDAGEQFFVLYGRYSNAKLLYSYGFVLPDNPYASLDYWVKVPPSDPGFGWKKALLRSNPLTAVQTYDFFGTLRSGGWISPALMATARVAQLTEQERSRAQNAFRGQIVSARNEAAALGSLLACLKRKLSSQRSSADAERELIDQLEEKKEKLRRMGDDGEHDESNVDCLASMVKLNREVMAARVRWEEKATVGEAIVALEKSLKQLQSVCTTNDEKALGNFHPIDAPNA